MNISRKLFLAGLVVLALPVVASEDLSPVGGQIPNAVENPADVKTFAEKISSFVSSVPGMPAQLVDGLGAARLQAYLAKEVEGVEPGFIAKNSTVISRGVVLGAAAAIVFATYKAYKLLSDDQDDLDEDDDFYFDVFEEDLEEGTEEEGTEEEGQFAE